MGIWPEERKWNRSSSYLVLLPFLTMMCFACGPQTINLSIIAADSDLVIENLSNNITFMVSIMKTLTVWINGIPLKSLLGYMANDWDAVTTNIERETMVNTARITRKITIGSTLMVNIVILAFVPARLSSMKNNDIALFLRGYYPYNTSISPNFELTMIGQYVAAIYAANTYTTVDTLVVLLIFHVCGQLSILRQDLGKIDSYDKKNIEMKMQKIVEKHEYINRFAGRIENSFNMMLLFQMLSCTIQICSQFYQVIMSLGENTMEHMILQISFLLIYVAYVMLQLFLYCYMGEKLAAEVLFRKEKSTEIANTAYNTKWYDLPPKNARGLVIIMCRARSSPLQITAGRFCSFTFALYCQYTFMIDKDIDLNYVYGWNYNMLKFIGIWPEERKWNRSSSYFILLPCIVMVCFICAPQTINLPIIAGDSDLVIENLSTNITITISLMKTMAVWIKGKHIHLSYSNCYTKRSIKTYSISHILLLQALKSLLRCMANDWDTVTNNADREKMVNIARITKKITIRSILLANIVVVAFLPARLSSMLYNDKELFYRGYYPYNTTISPNFELTLIGQLMAALYTAITYTTVDTFVVLLIFHVCGQLSILRDDLRKIHSYDDKNVEIKLQQIVQKHVYINRYVYLRFAETIEKSFNMMLLFQMLGCTTQLCSQTYQVLMSLGEEAIEHMILQITFLLIYVIYVMLQLLLYCYMGEKLTVESTEIANTAYNAEWYNLPPKNARWLVIIMCRARSSPLQITAGRFCCFTLVLYSQVLKTSMGYVSVLLAMKNK
ncbi:uncharacterized protein LOC117207169 [Bombus bifarius]|uniref:Uncharacterized protein LOC117207169 n=1 Tax=Bombus bifarius TaxID=103933 RepID=A0A6P8MLQ2_9HYME|nr:uncharacterized protein LOC117207169 [Bombus bifarius]